MRTVLIIEDNRDTSRVIAEFLARADLGAVSVTCAGDVTDELLNACDVAVVDLSLPDSGPRETLKLCEFWALSIPIVVLSGYVDLDIALTAWQQGVHAVLVKPGDLLSLVGTVKAAIGVREERRLLQELVLSFARMDGAVRTLKAYATLSLGHSGGQFDYN